MIICTKYISSYVWIKTNTPSFQATYATFLRKGKARPTPFGHYTPAPLGHPNVLSLQERPPVLHSFMFPQVAGSSKPHAPTSCSSCAAQRWTFHPCARQDTPFWLAISCSMAFFSSVARKHKNTVLKFQELARPLLSNNNKIITQVLLPLQPNK